MSFLNDFDERYLLRSLASKGLVHEIACNCAGRLHQRPVLMRAASCQPPGLILIACLKSSRACPYPPSGIRLFRSPPAFRVRACDPHVRASANTSTVYPPSLPLEHNLIFEYYIWLLG